MVCTCNIRKCACTIAATLASLEYIYTMDVGASWLLHWEIGEIKLPLRSSLALRCAHESFDVVLFFASIWEKSFIADTLCELALFSCQEVKFKRMENFSIRVIQNVSITLIKLLLCDIDSLHFILMS